MPREIQIFQISAEIVSKIDISTLNKIEVSFQLDGLTQSTGTVEYVETKPLVWQNSVKIPYQNGKTVNVKFNNSAVLLASSIFNIPSTFQENKNTLELLTSNKDKLAILMFKSKVSDSKKQDSPLKIQESPQKKDIGLSDRPSKKMTQKSEIKPEQKPESQKQNRMLLSAPNRNNTGFTGNQSFNKSTDTFKLPTIGDLSKNFGDRIYDIQSSATLQKSILVFSVPKAPRFGSGPKYAGQPSYYVDTCFKPNSSKGVGFGFGNKKQFPEWMQKNMKENPAPGTYFYQAKTSPKTEKKGNSSSHLHTRGPSFGISYKFYEKVTIPKERSPERNTASNQRLRPIYKLN